MKGPEHLDKLTDEDLEQVAALERDVEEWLGNSAHESYYVNTNVDPNRKIPMRVWEELVRRASRAGWDARVQGAIVEIRRP